MSTPPSQFPEYLTVAQRDGQGGIAIEPPAFTRGQPWTMTVNLPAHPEFGDWTDGAFSAPLLAAPGGTSLGEYVCTIGTPVGLLTPVTMTLSVAEQAGLPAANVGNKLAEVFLPLRYTPPGGAEQDVAFTRQLIKG